jgi:hypothetical protein
VGNAVPPLMAEGLGLALRNLLDLLNAQSAAASPALPARQRPKVSAQEKIFSGIVAD